MWQGVWGAQDVHAGMWGCGEGGTAWTEMCAHFTLPRGRPLPAASKHTCWCVGPPPTPLLLCHALQAAAGGEWQPPGHETGHDAPPTTTVTSCAHATHADYNSAAAVHFYRPSAFGAAAAAANGGGGSGSGCGAPAGAGASPSSALTGGDGCLADDGAAAATAAGVDAATAASMGAATAAGVGTATADVQVDPFHAPARLNSGELWGPDVVFVSDVFAEDHDKDVLQSVIVQVGGVCVRVCS